MNNRVSITLATSILLLSASQPAMAYIDPGSGSMIMTTILGFIAAIGYTARKYFYKVKNMLGGKGSQEEGKE
jgi:hypothetical protein